MSRWWSSSSGSGVVGFSGMPTSTSLRHCVRRATDDAFMSPVSGCQCRKRIHTELPARCPGRVGLAKYWGTRAPHAVRLLSCFLFPSCKPFSCPASSPESGCLRYLAAHRSRSSLQRRWPWVVYRRTKTGPCWSCWVPIEKVPIAYDEAIDAHFRELGTPFTY
jgi:hypothetical protein